MSIEKVNKRKVQALETKKKIYETAERLFKEHGFEKISVDSIVEAAGVSKGSFYVHYDSKDSLITTLIGDYVKKVDLDYKTYFESFPAGTMASDMLISLIRKIVDVITFTIGYDNMRIVYQVQITKTINTDAVMGYNRELYKLFSDMISKGVQQREFTTEIPVNTLVKHCIMAIRGLTYEWCIRYPDFNLMDQAVKHFEILLSGIKKQ